MMIYRVNSIVLCNGDEFMCQSSRICFKMTDQVRQIENATDASALNFGVTVTDADGESDTAQFDVTLTRVAQSSTIAMLYASSPVEQPALQSVMGRLLRRSRMMRGRTSLVSAM